MHTALAILGIVTGLLAAATALLAYLAAKHHTASQAATAEAARAKATLSDLTERITAADRDIESLCNRTGTVRNKKGTHA